MSIGRDTPATRRSIAAWALFGAFAGAVATWRLGESWWLIPAVSLAGGLLAALLEWLPGDDELEAPENE